MTSGRRCQALSIRPSHIGNDPPPWAKQIRSDRSIRSNTPPSTMARIDRWVSAGMPVSHCAIHRRSRGELGRSHGWTNTGSPTCAQCSRKVTMPASSRSRSPTWLPISTPACPAARHLSSSAHAASVSCSGTWQNGTSRSGAPAQMSRARSLKILAIRVASAALWAYPKNTGVGETTCTPTWSVSMSTTRTAGSQQSLWMRRNSRDPTMIIASRSESIRSQAGSAPGSAGHPCGTKWVCTSMAESAELIGPLLPGMHGSAGRAGARLLVAVERLEHRRQVVDDAADLQLDLVHPGTAVRAVPLELLQGALAADPLDHDADRAGLRTLWRMRQIAGQQPDVALPDVHGLRLAVLDDVDVHVSADLVEPLLVRVHVEVGPLVRSAHHHHDELVAPVHHPVVHRRLEQVFVLLHPVDEVEDRRHGHGVPLSVWSAAQRDRLDLDQQMWMRKLVHRNGGAGRRGIREVFGPDLVVTAEVVHRHQVRGGLDQIGQVGAVPLQDAANVVKHRAGLHPDVQRRGAQLVDRRTRDGVVGTPTARARDVDQVPGHPGVREAASR